MQTDLWSVNVEMLFWMLWTCGNHSESFVITSQKGQNYSFYDVTHKKNNRFFFIADSKTCQVFCGFEQLSSAIGEEAMDLKRLVQTALLGWKHVEPRC